MTVGQEIALLKWRGIDHSLMTRETVSSEAQAHYMPLDAEEAREGVVRIPCLAGGWNILGLAFDKTESLELEMEPVNHTLGIVLEGALPVFGNIALAEQGRARVNHELNYVLKGACMIVANSPTCWLGSATAPGT